MNKRTPSERVQDFNSLFKDDNGPVPFTAARKLYKLSMELVERLTLSELRLQDARDETLQASQEVNTNMYAEQMREMAKELSTLKLVIEELKEENRFLKLPAQVNKPMAPSKPKTPERK